MDGNSLVTFWLEILTIILFNRIPVIFLIYSVSYHKYSIDYEEQFASQQDFSLRRGISIHWEYLFLYNSSSRLIYLRWYMVKGLV